MNLFRPNVIINTLPVTLLNGTTADATQVMSDLNWIVNQVNANAAPVAGVALLAAANTFTMVQSGVNANAPANFPTALQVQNNAFNTLSSVAGTGNAITANAPISFSGAVPGLIFNFIPAAPNGVGGVVININAAGSEVLTAGGQALGSGALSPLRTALIRSNGIGAGYDFLNQGITFAQSSDIISGASNSLVMTPAQTLAAFGLSGMFNSGPQTITAGGALTLPHGLGRLPSFIQLSLFCLASDANYSPGNTIYLDQGFDPAGGTSKGVAIFPDTTNIGVRFGSTASTFEYLSKTTGSVTGLVNANWKFIIKALG